MQLNYLKLQKGKYEELHFISQSSRLLISQMLQVDPKKRITIKELLSHSWLTKGALNPINVRVENVKKRDDDCLSALSNYYGINTDQLWDHLGKWNYDYGTSTYLLLQSRKRKRLPLVLHNSASKRMFVLDKVMIFLV